MGVRKGAARAGPFYLAAARLEGGSREVRCCAVPLWSCKSCASVSIPEASIRSPTATSISSRRAGHLVDKLVIAIGTHHDKHPLFTAKERVDLVAEVLDPVAARSGSNSKYPPTTI